MGRRYLDTRVDAVTETLAGIPFEDPYRWLESDTPEVRRWQSAQSERANAYVREWPHFSRLRKLVAGFSTEHHFEQASLPRHAAGRWFRMHNVEGGSHAQAVVADEPMGAYRILFDPRSENPDHPPYLLWIAPSPDGCTLALGVCTDGSENNTIRLIDVASGRMLEDPPPHTLMDANTGGVQWLADSSGFFFSAITGTAIEFEQKVYLHRRSGSPATTLVDVPWTQTTDYRMVVVSRDGRHAVAFERCLNTIPVAVARLDRGPVQWRPFITTIAGTVAGEVIGDRYIGVTDVGAPRGRLVAIDLDNPDANDSRSWHELVPESHAVLRTVAQVGQTLYLTELTDTYVRVRTVDLQGKALGEVPLPGRGALVSASIYPLLDLIAKGPPDRFLFAFSALTVSRGIYSHTPGQNHIETLQAPQARLHDAVVEDRSAVSRDGTRIPYHVVRLASTDPQAPQPTLICAYGAYGAVFVPQFPGSMAAFVAAGGVFVHAHLRGGGEFGLEWWRAGRMANKQNGYDDLYAIAEEMIASGRTTPELLAVTGESNGGLMAGVALTQRPDLWAVAVPRVPMFDLIGACRYPYGRWCVTLELADIQEPEAVRRLTSISPYHLVRDGVRYPAVFLDVGDTDPRCPPWHARKFAARMQRANPDGAPILLRVLENVGHGAATNKDVAIGEFTDWLAFTMRNLPSKAWFE
jgi:prolyl oligopeptidase